MYVFVRNDFHIVEATELRTVVATAASLSGVVVPVLPRVSAPTRKDGIRLADDVGLPVTRRAPILLGRRRVEVIF